MDHAVSESARPYFDQVLKLAPTIREYADRAEREAQMPGEVAEAFHQAGLFRILLPRSLGGGELTIPDSLRLAEEVARIDGSAAWNLAIGSDGPLFGHSVVHFRTSGLQSLATPNVCQRF